MKFQIHDLKEYPFQPISDFAEARNWFIRRLENDEYVLFTSDHEELPKMLLDYIGNLAPTYPYYKIRLIRLVNNRLETLYDPMYQPNLCSNKMRFEYGFREIPFPLRPFGMIDIPMIHNRKGGHSYTFPPTRAHLPHLLRRLFTVYRAITYDELGRGLFRKGEPRYY